MKHRLSNLAVILVFLLLPAAASKAQDGLNGALGQLGNASAPIGDLTERFVAADFDRDHMPDGAILQEAGLWEGKRAFRIQLHLSASNNNAITFSTVETGLSISAFDVDRDGAPDIIVEKAFTHQRIQIYLNDGHGAFHRARIEDYPSSDPSGPNWRGQLNPSLSVACLPTSGSLEIGILKRVSMLDRNAMEQSNFWPETLLLQSGPRGPTTSRAPPSFLSL